MDGNVAALTELSLFSGAGGGLLGTKYLLGWRTVCYVEWDKYAVEVLRARIRDGYLDDAPIWDDAFTFDGRPWAGLVDVVTAGFPCQPFSVAGKGLAEHDPRNGWPAVIRILREVRPRYALLENVPGLLSKSYIRTVFGDLAEAGYAAEWDCITAQEIGANHKRERLWIVAHAIEWKQGLTPETGQCWTSKLSQGSNVAHAQGEGTRRLSIQPRRSLEASTDSIWSREDVADARSQGLSKPEQKRGAQRPTPESGWWAVEPELGRVADGVAHRVDRLRAIGNGQVPRVAGEAWERMSHDKA